MKHTFYAVVDANGEFKRRNHADSGEYETERKANQFRVSLPNPEDYTVQSFTEEEEL